MLSDNKVEILSTGYRVLVNKAPAMVIAKAQTSVPLPETPVFIDPDTGKKHYNQLDPSYIAAVERATQEGQQRALLAAVLFGMTLVNEADEPIDAPDDGWETSLKMVGIDWESDVRKIISDFSEKSANYSRMRNAMFILYVAIVDKSDLDVVVRAMGGKTEDMEGDGIEAAAAAFRS